MTTATFQPDHVPNPIDIHVGGRIRLRRKLLSISQEKLAFSLGLTFQQVQKYERGTNRVSASKLYQIATTLDVPIDYFFIGLADPAEAEAHDAASAEPFIHEFLMTSEGLELAQQFPRMKSRRLRRRVLDLVRVVAIDEGEAD